MLGPPLEEQTAPGRIASLVAGWWSSTVSGSGVVVPDGAVDLVWAEPYGVSLAGPDTRPRAVDLCVGTDVVGLRLQTGVARELLGGRVDQVMDRQVHLSTVLGRSAFDQLDDELGSSMSPQDVATRISAALVEWIPESWTPDGVILDAAKRLRSGQPLGRHGLSDRQFRRRFGATMGVGPGFYRRLTRLDRFTDLLAGNPQRSISELAAEAGYFDESHLSRDCVALTGSTPGSLRSNG